MNEDARRSKASQSPATGTWRASRATRRPRRSDAVHVVGGALSPKLHAAWRALRLPALKEHGSAEALADAVTHRVRRAGMPGATRVALVVRDSVGLVSAAALAGSLRGREGFRLVLLVDCDDVATWEGAAALTSHCYPAALSPPALARLIAAAMEVRRFDKGRRAGLPDRVTLTLWESVEVDGRAVYLGVAERNFLFTLARRPGTLIPKKQLIEAGPGQFLTAAACRRRLGQRLGPLLASLLVPPSRFDPYRMREPPEVAAVSERLRGDGVVLRIIGRACVMGV